MKLFHIWIFCVSCIVFTESHNKSKIHFNATSKDRSGFELNDDNSFHSYNLKSSDLPPDNGANYGDLIHLRRQERDVLLSREVIINEDYYSTDTDLRYNNAFRGFRVTTVRAVNLGRQRAYVTGIRSSANNNGQVELEAVIGQNQQIRLLVEVYGSQ